ncbi:hypothetical protein OAT70_00365 [Gammaproteobacteria bacterium]|nr:hypothetical protein [Gammaproteobacteria bacterium]
MTDQDKILIMSYLDNELSADEVSSVEALISSDSAAQDYLNQLKMTNNEVDAFFSSEDMKLLDTSISKFVESLKPKETVSSFQFGEVISSFFAPKQALSYSFTAVLFLVVGLFFQNLTYQEILFDLNGEMYEKQVFITRGSSVDVGLKGEMHEMIYEMVQNKSPEGNLTYGSSVYAIFLEDKTIETDALSCYAGQYYIAGKNQEFVFCESDQDTSLIFIN